MNGTDSSRTAGTPTGEESSAIASKVLAAAAFLAFPLVILAHKGLAPLLVLAALAVFANAAVNRTLNWRAGPFSWAYLALVIYAGLSAAWSIAPKEALTTVPSVAAIGLGGVILIVAARQFSSDARMSVRRALILGGAAGIAILTYEILTAGELIRIARDALGLSTPQERHVMLVFNSALSVGAIFLWPWLAAIRRAFSVRWAAAGALAASAALIVSQADAPKFAAIAGFVLFGAAWMSKRGLAMALSAVIIAGIAAAPQVYEHEASPALASAYTMTFLLNRTHQHLKKLRPFPESGLEGLTDLLQNFLSEQS